MATYHAIPKTFAKMHKKYFTPTVSTLSMGGVSIVLYIWFNYESHGNVIPDAVTAIGVLHRPLLRAHRHQLRLVLPQGPPPERPRPVDEGDTAWARRRDALVLPRLGAVHRLQLQQHHCRQLHLVVSCRSRRTPSWVASSRSPSSPGLVGLVLMGVWTRFGKDFFQGRTLNRNTPTLVPDDGSGPMIGESS